MNENSSENSGAQTAALQKLWAEFAAKSLEAGLAFAANPPPPEVARRIRSELFQSMAESWEKFMRSPQFLDAMKQMMEQAITARKMTNDFLGQARHEMQAPSREDLDSVMLSVRHLETRLLDRIEELSNQISQLSRRPSAGGPKPNPPGNARRPARNSGKAPP